jgi:hypothetical protein
MKKCAKYASLLKSDSRERIFTGILLDTSARQWHVFSELADKIQQKFQVNLKSFDP